MSVTGGSSAQPLTASMVGFKVRVMAAAAVFILGGAGHPWAAVAPIALEKLLSCAGPFQQNDAFRRSNTTLLPLQLTARALRFATLKSVAPDRPTMRTVLPLVPDTQRARFSSQRSVAVF